VTTVGQGPMSPATPQMAQVMVLGQAVLDTVVNRTSGAPAVAATEPSAWRRDGAVPRPDPPYRTR